MSEIQRIIVTGSNGRVGRALVAYWKDHGHVVVGYDLPVDLRKSDLVTGFEGTDTVVHLATARPSPYEPIETAESNIQMAVNVLRVSSRAKVRRVIFASSCWASPEEHGIPNFTYYSASKIAMEALLRAWSEEQAAPSVAIRIGYYPDADGLGNELAESLRITKPQLCAEFDRAISFDLSKSVIWTANRAALTKPAEENKT